MPLADAHFEPIGEIVVAHLTGEIDMSNADEIADAISVQTPADARALVLDLREVVYTDSAGIRLIYNLRSRLDHRGQQLRLVVEPGGPITDALRVADVPRAVGAVETVDAAVASLS